MLKPWLRWPKLEISFAHEQVHVNGENFTDAIRTEDAGNSASQVASLPTVRDAIFNCSRAFGERRVGGRWSGHGTVVFADAPVKIFLDASAEARAERRYNQLKNNGLGVNLRALLEQIQERDARDRERAVAPLKPAKDALIIDSTKMTIDEVVATVMAQISSKIE